MSTPNGKSILKCPACNKSLINIGSKVERIHPMARFIDRNYFGLCFGFGAVSPIVLLAFGPPDRGIGLGWLGCIALPAMFFYVLKRLYPVYRVTDCPYCKYHEELYLGHSFDA